MKAWIDDLPWVVRQAWPSGGLSFYPAGRQRRACRLGVAHSTETTGFPGYNGGAAAPHFTIDFRTGEVRQHVPLDYGSRCLAVSTRNHLTGVWHTNRTVNIDGVVQIEGIGAVTPGYPAKYGHYDLVNTFPTDERAHFYLARLLRAIHDATDGGVPLTTSGYADFVMYPKSYGVGAPQRLSDAEFADARGWIGHQHVPANDHGDGTWGRAVSGKAVDFEDVLALARSMKPTDMATPPDYGSTPSPSNNFGFPAEHIGDVQRTVNELIELGLLDLEPLLVDESLGSKTMTAVRALQALLGFPEADQDGLPGPRTTDATEDLMASLTDLPKTIAAAVVNAAISPMKHTREALNIPEGQTRTLGWFLDVASRNSVSAKRHALAAVAIGNANAERMAGLEAAVKALAEATPEVDAAAVNKALESAAGQYRVTLEKVETELAQAEEQA